MCNCIEEIKKQVANNNNAASAHFTGGGEHQKSEISYKPYRRDGIEAINARYISVPWNYCPFCGLGLRG